MGSIPDLLEVIIDGLDGCTTVFMLVVVVGAVVVVMFKDENGSDTIRTVFLGLDVMRLVS